MARFIQTQNGTALRKKYLEFIAATIHALAGKKEIDDESKDMVSFIILMLAQINQTIEKATNAWEKKDYWVKADQFRMEWQWSNKMEKDLKIALQENNWNDIVNIMIVLANKCANTNPRKKIISAKPWIGAHAQLKKELKYNS